MEDDVLTECECDNTHTVSKTVCRYCWDKGKRFEKLPDKTVTVLCDLLEWAKGNRGAKSGNPYLIPEIKAALKHLARLQGIDDHLDVKTDLS